MEPVKIAICALPSLGTNGIVDDEKDTLNLSDNEVVVIGESGDEDTFTSNFEVLSLLDLEIQSKKEFVEKVYQNVGKVVVKNAFCGYNATLISYSRKELNRSWLMMGDQSDDLEGIIHHVCDGVFEKAAEYDDATSFRAEISFFEICGETITDLTARRSSIKSTEKIGKLKVKEENNVIQVDKLTKHIITDAGEMKTILERALKNRKRLAALDKASQGQSHTIFSIVLTQARMENGTPLELVSKVNLIDLACDHDSHVVPPCNGHKNGNGVSNGFAHDEEDLEKPMIVFKEVLSALSSQKRRRPFVPYKDSSLTLLMKDAFGGNCRTVMLCCLGNSDSAVTENHEALQMARMASQVINRPIINEDVNVKMIRDLKKEIDLLKSDPKTASILKSDAALKLQRDEQLVNRLTGIWEEKWNKTRKLMEEKEVDVTDSGQGIRLETKEPHIISLGGGRLSVGISIMPIKQGITTIGQPSDDGGLKPDVILRGKGISRNHCTLEYDGEDVVLHPRDASIAVDGIPITAATKLHQGCTLSIGQSNFFRFNHPTEAAKIRSEIPAGRFSIVPDVVCPDIQLAVEQRRKELQEKERLRTENKRLLDVEQQYLESLGRLKYEQEQLEQEKRKLQALQQQQQSVANQFQRKISIQIEELELKKQELKKYDLEKGPLSSKEKELDEADIELDKNLSQEEARRRTARESLLAKQAELDLAEFEQLEQEALKSSLSPTSLRRLASGSTKENVMRLRKELEMEVRRSGLDLDKGSNGCEDTRLKDLYERQKFGLVLERARFEEMEKLHRRLETDLSRQIERLQQDRTNQLQIITAEKENLKNLELKQEEALHRIETDKLRLQDEREAEKQKVLDVTSRIAKMETMRFSALQKAAEEQEKERVVIETEKQRLLDLEQHHLREMSELEQRIVTQQEKLEKERQLEQEYIETEQLMLEELEQKQFESARQMEHECQLIKDELTKAQEDERRKSKESKDYFMRLADEHERALHETETERRRLQELRENEATLLKQERDRFAQIEKQHREYSRRMEAEKESLRQQYESEKKEEIERMQQKFNRSLSSPTQQSMTNGVFDFDPALLIRSWTPSDKMQQIEDERNRLSELKRQAAERAQLEWLAKKKDMERKTQEEKSLEERRRKLEEMRKEQLQEAQKERRLIEEEQERIRQHEERLKMKEKELDDLKQERERRQELELLLETELSNETELEKTLLAEKDRLLELEQSLEEERTKRLQVEKMLDDRRRSEEEDEQRNRLRSEDTRRFDCSKSETSSIRKRINSCGASLRSHASVFDDIHLLRHIVAGGHVLEHCPSLKLNRYSCRGYLSKMGKSKLHLSWNKRWFVFDRKLRALSYYHDDRKTKASGIIYFQAIQEVYVDSGYKRSPNIHTTFCIKTQQRNYILCASSPTAMSIWIDVICTGREGALC